jgi:hypothetical protein
VSESLLIRVTIWTAFLTMAFGLVISSVGRGFSKVELSDGLTRLGLALEVPNDPQQIYEVIGLPSDQSRQATADRAVAARLQYWDFCLIPSYMVMFAAAGLLQFKKLEKPWNYAGLLAAIAIFIAGVCDFGEDFGILRAVRATGAGMMADADAIAFWGWTKWELLFAALPFLAPLLLDRSPRTLSRRSSLLRWAGLLLGILMIGSGLFGLVACWFRHRGRLSEATVGLVGIPWFFWPLLPLFRDGAVQGLERVANFPLIRWMTSWPKTNTEKPN